MPITPVEGFRDDAASAARRARTGRSENMTWRHWHGEAVAVFCGTTVAAVRAFLRFFYLASATDAVPVHAGNGDVLMRERFVPVTSYAEWFAKAFANSDEPLDPT